MIELTQHPAFEHWVAWGIERAQVWANGTHGRFEAPQSDEQGEVALGDHWPADRPSDLLQSTVFEKESGK